MSTTCPVCGGSSFTSFVHRADVPVHQHMLQQTIDDARTMKRGQLEMAVCHDCGFVFNRQFDESLLQYGEDYDNTQHCSGYFDRYLDERAQQLVEQHDVRNAAIVEVGCGDGHFLKKLVAYAGANNRGWGFDPSYRGPVEQLDGRLQFDTRFYGEDCSDIKADVVICRHVIEHIQQPASLLKAVKLALRDSPNARVFFETPCVEWILKHRVIWDFFYEHCSLFSADSLGYLFAREGFHVHSVHHIFGDQYLWLEATVGDQEPRKPSSDMVALATAYKKDEQTQLHKWSAIIQTHQQDGIALWGAGAKGATLANLIDPDAISIRALIDVNPEKQGRFVPGTGHPIIAPSEIANQTIRHALLMNPNYREEILAMLAQDGIELNLIMGSE